MAITIDDFDKVWASESPLTPYEFNDSQYKQGWNFVGATPPSRQMWDAFMKNADEKLKYLYNHEDVPVGFEYFTMNPNIPQGSLPLLGGEYSRETYSALWSWVQEQTGYLKTEAEWQALSTSNNGNVPFYSDGDGSTTFRVPSLHCWIKGSDGSAQLVGSYLAAGLPNITGHWQEFYGGLNRDAQTYGGAIYLESTTTGAVGTNQTDLKGDVAGFDASRSSSIYGNANTVQPESIVGMWLVKAYGTIVDTGQIDEQAYIDDRYNAMKTYVDGKFLPAVGNAVVGDLSAVESQGIATSISGVDIWIYKLGRLVTFKIDGVGTLPASQTAYNIATVPALYRPITDLFFDCVLTASDAVLGHARIAINATTGVVTVVSNRADISEWRGVCSYISAS